MEMTDWLGAIGVFLILAAYFLNVTGKIDSKSFRYVILNFVGAVLACVASILLHYIPFIILEAMWALVSLKVLYDIGKNRL